MKNIGVTVGSQPEFFSKFQKLIWEEDTFEVVSHEFYEMVKLISLSETTQGIVSLSNKDKNDSIE